jgi:hypothetical protein
MAEGSGGQNKGLVTPAEQIGVRGLPHAMAIGDIGGDMVAGAGEAAQIGDHPRHQIHQWPLIDIGRGPVHRGQNPVGHDGGAGNGEIGTT